MLSVSKSSKADNSVASPPTTGAVYVGGTPRLKSVVSATVVVLIPGVEKLGPVGVSGEVGGASITALARSTFVTIAANAELQEAAQGDAGNRIKLKNSSNGNMEFKLENSAYNYVFPDGKFGIGTTSIPSTHTDIAHLSIGADASIIGTKASGTSSNSTFAHNAYFDS